MCAAFVALERSQAGEMRKKSAAHGLSPFKFRLHAARRTRKFPGILLGICAPPHREASAATVVFQWARSTVRREAIPRHLLLTSGNVGFRMQARVLEDELRAANTIRVLPPSTAARGSKSSGLTRWSCRQSPRAPNTPTITPADRTLPSRKNPGFRPFSPPYHGARGMTAACHSLDDPGVFFGRRCSVIVPHRPDRRKNSAPHQRKNGR